MSGETRSERRFAPRWIGARGACGGRRWGSGSGVHSRGEEGEGEVRRGRWEGRVHKQIASRIET